MNSNFHTKNLRVNFVPFFFKFFFIRIIDLIIASSFILILSPLYLIIVISILLEDGKPIFFKQKRVGKNKIIFTILKFRTMSNDSKRFLGDNLKKNSLQIYKTTEPNDPRVTKVGKFLRRTHLDELPQFFNVINNTMSIVGVRPVTLVEKNFYDDFDWENRHLYKPGITGLAQLEKSSDILNEKIKYDNKWIRDFSILLYITIIVRTPLKIIKSNSL